MRSVLFLVLFVGVVMATPDKKEENSPKKKELFAKEDWYKDQTSQEEAFEGFLKKRKDDAGIGIVQRFNPYQLLTKIEPGEESKKKGTVGKITMMRDVYVGGKNDILDAFAGKKVKIVGKFVKMELEGQTNYEIWPARVELLDTKESTETPKKP